MVLDIPKAKGEQIYEYVLARAVLLGESWQTILDLAESRAAFEKSDQELFSVTDEGYEMKYGEMLGFDPIALGRAAKRGDLDGLTLADMVRNLPDIGDEPPAEPHHHRKVRMDG